MHPRIVLSVGNFFFSTFSALVTFSLLPYLSSVMPAAYAGLVVALGAFCAMLVFPFLPSLVEKYGAQHLALVVAFSLMLILLALTAAPGVWVAVFLLGMVVAMQPFLSYQLDVLLEATIADTKTTGRVRALFRTAWSVGALAAPLMLGILLVNSDSYGRVFLAAAALLIPFVLIFASRKLPKGPAPKLHHMRDTLERIMKNRDLAAVTFGNLLLYLFIVWMPLYTPVYLHTILGISWANLGWMFAIMLLPYALLEYPSAWLADRYIGDKELMLTGFVIAGGAMITLSFLTSATPLLIVLGVLVASRVGAALMESMIEAHFFRRVAKRDINSVSVFRGVWPLSHILGPITGSVLILYGGYSLFFLITGAFIAAAGAATTLLIKDFK